MPETRIYLVAQDTGVKRLVDAATPAQAIRYVTRGAYTAKPATPKDVAALVGEGVPVEHAGDEAAQAELRG